MFFSKKGGMNDIVIKVSKNKKKIEANIPIKQTISNLKRKNVFRLRRKKKHLLLSYKQIGLRRAHFQHQRR